MVLSRFAQVIQVIRGHRTDKKGRFGRTKASSSETKLQPFGENNFINQEDNESLRY